MCQLPVAGGVTATGTITKDVSPEETGTSKMSFTSIKDKSPKSSPETTEVPTKSNKESVVCVFSRRKVHKESSTSSSCSDDLASPQESPVSSDAKDDNHNTVPKKKKKSRRAAIGLPSEMSAETQQMSSENGSTDESTRSKTSKDDNSAKGMGSIKLFCRKLLQYFNNCLL